MKTLLTILCLVTVASVAWAEKPVQTVDNPIDRIECSFENIAYDWDFAVSGWGFATGPCDDGGVPTWEYGTSIYWEEPLWATSLTTDAEELYPNDAGESLISPNFIVDDSAYLVEVAHGYVIEPGFDGGNLSVNGVVIEPMVDPYPEDEISASAAYYAWCVDGEPGFSGEQVSQVTSCFDLSAFMGEEVQVSFDFGSDSSVQYAGWFIMAVRVGGDVVANDGTTWSAMKGLYR